MYSMDHPCAPAVPDPLLRAPAALFGAVCLPLRVGLGGAMLLGWSAGLQWVSPVLLFAFFGLSRKRAALRGVCLWKDYGRLPLLAAAGVAAALGADGAPARASAAALAAAGVGAVWWHPGVAAGLLAGAAAGAAGGWGRAAGAMLLADAAQGWAKKYQCAA